MLELFADETEAELCDWKFGKNGVEEARNNLQGMSYALGLRKRFPKIKSVRVFFFLPHRDEIHEHLFTTDDFDRMYLRIRTVVARAVAARQNGDYATANPTEGTCLFCANVGRCPKVASLVIRLGKKYDPLQIPDNVTPTLISDPKKAALGLKLRRCKIVGGVLRAQARCEDHSRPRFHSGRLACETSKEKLWTPEIRGYCKTVPSIGTVGAVEKLLTSPSRRWKNSSATAAARLHKDETGEGIRAAMLENGAVQRASRMYFFGTSKGTEKGSVVRRVVKQKPKLKGKNGS
jgi:hypothetical protein